MGSDRATGERSLSANGCTRRREFPPGVTMPMSEPRRPQGYFDPMLQDELFPLRRAVRRVLIVKFKQIGDTVLATPTIRAMREAFPEAEIGWAGFSDTLPVLESNPNVSRFHPYPKEWRGERGISRIRCELRYLSEVRERRYDLAVHLGTGTRGVLLTLLSGARYRVGPLPSGKLSKRFWGKWLFYTHPYFLMNPHIHAVERDLDAARRIGFEPRSRRLEVVVREEESQSAQQRLLKQGRDSSRPLLHVHPTSHLPFKCWRAEAMAEVLDHFGRKGFDIVLTGGPTAEEREQAEKIISYMHHRPIDLAGKTSLREVAAISRLAVVFFGVDSSVMHLAAAVGTPVVALFGPTYSELWGPWGAGHRVIAKAKPCLPCGQMGCPGLKRSLCLEELIPAEVIPEIEAALAEQGRSRRKSFHLIS